MKKIQLITVISAFSICSNAQNGAFMEYRISSSKGATGSVKVKYSEFGTASDFNMSMPQMPGGGMQFKSLSMSSAPDVIYKIDDSNRTYSESKKNESSEDTRSYTVIKVGEETVNGYKCVHCTISDGKEVHEEWNTRDIPGFEKYEEAFKSGKSMRSGSPKRDAAVKAAGCDGMPVKSFHKGNEREGDMTMELVKMEKKTYSRSDFELPTGYAKSETTRPGVGAPKTQDEIMKMSPEERTKYIGEMKKKYGQK
jgi:hypothetical protein